MQDIAGMWSMQSMQGRADTVPVFLIFALFCLILTPATCNGVTARRRISARRPAASVTRCLNRQGLSGFALHGHLC